jgi:hypothetical protein
MGPLNKEPTMAPRMSAETIKLSSVYEGVGFKAFGRNINTGAMMPVLYPVIREAKETTIAYP